MGKAKFYTIDDPFVKQNAPVIHKVFTTNPYREKVASGKGYQFAKQMSLDIKARVARKAQRE